MRESFFCFSRLSSIWRSQKSSSKYSTKIFYDTVRVFISTKISNRSIFLKFYLGNRGKEDVAGLTLEGCFLPPQTIGKLKVPNSIIKPVTIQIMKRLGR